MRKHMAMISIICVALFYLTACEKKAAEEEQIGYQESLFNNSEEADQDNISRLKQLVVGEDYFLVLYEDGSVWGWGIMLRESWEQRKVMFSNPRG